ncbi:MAG: dihydrodipicolinate synthase family protein, partial [Gemmatimonadota bacterium]|nr:dihydrodipicolinate synthase family protein [Gemmatimonadota bacterium]
MADNTVDLGGTFLPVTTPFDPVTGDVDIVAFRSNLRSWMEHPVRGILIAGSTGESVFLDEAERVALVEAAADVVQHERVVIVGTGSESTRHTIHLTQQAADAGADAVLVSPPAYFKGAMTPRVLARHYRAVADASPVPLLVYQVPLRLSTLELPTGLIGELSQHPNIVGIKDSRGKLDLVGELVQATGDDFQVMVGSGALLYGALEIGAKGGIVAVGLMAAREAAEISVAFAEGRTADAGRTQERIAP